MSGVATASPNSSCALLNQAHVKTVFKLKYFERQAGMNMVSDGATYQTCDGIVTAINPSTKAKQKFIRHHALALVAAGRIATLHVETWKSVGDPSDPFDPDKVLTDFETASHGFYIGALHGTSFGLQALGASAAVGYQGPKAGRRQASGMWRGAERVIELTVLEKRSLPIEKRLKKLAANTVAAFMP